MSKSNIGLSVSELTLHTVDYRKVLPSQSGSLSKKSVDLLPPKQCDYGVVNKGYDGASISESVRIDIGAPTSVVREQYWACARWPRAQKGLALAVGILLGAVISLAIIVGTNQQKNVLPGL